MTTATATKTRDEDSSFLVDESLNWEYRLELKAVLIWSGGLPELFFLSSRLSPLPLSFSLSGVCCTELGFNRKGAEQEKPSAQFPF